MAASVCTNFWLIILTLEGAAARYASIGPAPSCGEGMAGLTHSGLDRDYIVYRPCRVPRAVLVSVHCFGCSAENQFTPFLHLAKEHDLLLLAPEGVENSFNGVHCCGPALRRGLDDAGFVRSAVETEDHGRGLPVLGTGHSNGGFLVSHLAKVYPGWLRGIAVSSGHVYQGIEELKGTAAAIFWDKDDSYVRYDGCCRNRSVPPCCCGISQDSPSQCTSAPEIFRAWQKTNECQHSTQTSSDHRAVCQVGTSCSQPTEFCTYTGHGHSSWATTPNFLTRRIIDFFKPLLELSAPKAEL